MFIVDSLRSNQVFEMNFLIKITPLYAILTKWISKCHGLLDTIPVSDTENVEYNFNISSL